MKKIFAIFVVTAVLTPVFASADSFGIEPTLGQLLTRVAALQAIVAGKSLNCAVAATKTTVKVGEEFTLAWGSYGADAKYSTDPQNVYTENGEQKMMLETPQTRTYHLSFFGPSGAKVTCDQTITATR